MSDSVQLKTDVFKITLTLNIIYYNLIADRKGFCLVSRVQTIHSLIPYQNSILKGCYCLIGINGDFFKTKMTLKIVLTW